MREPERLKYLLAPVLCRSGAEQMQFYPIFDAYLEEVRTQDWELSAPPRRQLSWWLWLLGVGLAAALLYVAWLLVQPPRPNEVPAADFSGPTYASEGDTVQFENTSFLPGDSSAYGVSWELRDATTGKTVTADTGTFDWAFIVPTLVDTSYRKEVQLHILSPDGQTKYTAKQPFDILCPVPPGVVGIEGLPAGRAFAVGTPIGPLRPLLNNTETGNPAENPWTFSWQTGDGQTLTGPEVRHTYGQAGLYTLRLSVRDTSAGAYCSTSVQLEVEVKEPDRDTLVALPPLAYQRLQEQPVASWRSWVWQVPYFLALFVIGLWWRWWDKRRVTPEDPAAAGPRIPRAEVADRAPYYIPWQNHSHYLPIGAAQFRLADAMRLRQAGTRRNIDVAGTVDATVQRGGFPDVRYAQSTRPSEYLLLIDEEAERSHLGRLFRHLATQLRGQDVFAEVFYYRKQFNRFWNADHPGGLSLGKLAFYHNKHRLLILGDAHELLDPGATDVPRLRPETLAALRAWRERILLTPQPPVSWTYREKLLARQFALFPADLRGLSDAAQWLEVNAEDPSELFDSWKDRQIQLRREADVEYRRWRRWRDHRDYLAPHPALETWFLALAVYPQPNWELTIAIGRALQDQGVEVNYDNLLYLARIPSLREGRFEPRLRREMLRELDPVLEARARRVVREELEAVRLLAGKGHAGLELESELALQSFALDPTDPEARETIRQLLAAGLLTPQQRGDLSRTIEREETAQENDSTGSFLQSTLKTTAEPEPVRIEEYFAEAPVAPLSRPPFFGTRFWGAAVASLLVLLLFAALLRTDRTPGLQRRLFGTPAETEAASSGLERRAPRKNLFAEEVYRVSGAQDAHDAALRALQEGDYATAESRFRTAMRLQNFQPSEAELNLLRLYYNRGRDYFNVYQGDLEQRALLDTAGRYFQLGVGFPAALRDSLRARGLARLFSDSMRWEPILEQHRHGLGLTYFFAGDTALAEAMYLTLPRRFFDNLSYSPNLQTFVAGDEESSRLLGLSPRESENNVTELVVNYYLQTGNTQEPTFVEAIVTNDTSVRAVPLPSTRVNGSTAVGGGLGSAVLRLEPLREYPEQADSILVLLRQGDAEVLDRRWLAYPKDWTAPETQSFEPYQLTVRDELTQAIVDNVQLTITESLEKGDSRQVHRTYVNPGASTLLPQPLRENMRFSFRHEGYTARELSYDAFTNLLREKGLVELTPTRGYVRDRVQQLLAKENYEAALRLMIAWARDNNRQAVPELENLLQQIQRARQLRERGVLAQVEWEDQLTRIRSLIGDLIGGSAVGATPRRDDVKKVPLEPIKTAPDPSATPQRDIPQQQQQQQIPIPLDPKTKEVSQRVGQSRWIGDNDPVQITDFDGATSGRYQVELDLFTNVYNSTAKLRAVIDLDRTVIEVRSYSHFQSKEGSDSLNGDGTASVTTESRAYSQFRVYLSGGALYLEQVANAAGAEGQLRLAGGTWQPIISPLRLPIQRSSGKRG